MVRLMTANNKKPGNFFQSASNLYRNTFNKINSFRGVFSHDIGIDLGTANTLVDHVVQAHACAVPAYVHAHAHEYSDDAGVLADRPVAGRTHPRVDQDLCHGIAGCWRFFAQVGLVHRLDEVDGVVVGDELQSVSNALYQVVLLDHGHAARPLGGAKTVRIEKATDTLSKKCAAV